MKRKFILVLLTILTGSFLLSSCGKDEVFYYGPRIIIHGDNPLYINIGDNWKNFVPKHHAEAYDDYYGIVDFFYRDNVNNEVAGKYTIEYVAIDFAGNETTKDRIVYVENRSSFLDGNYMVTNVSNGNSHEFESDITSSGIINDRLYISKLTKNSEGTVYMDLSGNNQIVIPQQKVGDYTYIGQGSFSDVNGEVNIVINYTEIKGNIAEQGVSSFAKNIIQ